MLIFFLYLSIILKNRDIYSLDCKYYDREFSTIDALIDDVVSSGMDPNYEITRNGSGTGDIIIDLMPF